MTRDEKDLFAYLKENYIPDIVFCRNQMSRWDCYSPKQKFRIELKCRRKHYPDLLIEKKKFDALTTEAKKHTDRPIYICSTPKGVWAFDLNEVPEIQWEIKRMPETTDFNRKTRVKKEVGHINIKHGYKL